MNAWTNANVMFALTMGETRRMIGISQEVLAQEASAIGVNVKLCQQQITKIENCSRDVRLNEAVAIAEVLGLTLGEML